MNKQIRIEVRWSYPTDATPGMRARDLVYPVPVEGETVPILEAALTVPEAIERVIHLDLGVSDQSPTNDKIVEALAEEAIRRSGEIEEARLAEEARAAKAGVRARGKIDAVLVRVRGEGEGEDCPWELVGEITEGSVLSAVTVGELAEIQAWQAGRDAAVAERHQISYRAETAARLKRLRAGEDDHYGLGSNATDDEKAEAAELRAKIKQATVNKRAENKAQRASEIRVWASRYGSVRLCEQIRQGLTGWPLYLSERLEHEIPGAEIDESDGDDCREIVNPTEAAMAVASDLAAQLEVVLDFTNSGYTTSLELVSIQEITFPAEDGGDCYEPEPNVQIYACCFGGKWRPGSEAFRSYDIRLEVE